MKQILSIRVVPKLPASISRMKELAYNLYYSWHPEVRDLFIDIDENLWTTVNHNPVKFLREVEQKKLEIVANNTDYLNRYKTVLQRFDQYMDSRSTWFAKNCAEHKDKVIAYFTAEFGFHESLPIYAGGLGVLAGDHIKSASDLGIPVVGISLFYSESYFKQEIDNQGNQQAIYPKLNPMELPIIPLTREDGSLITVKVPVANRDVFIKAWEVTVGHVKAYLLDTNLPENSSADREITSHLYGGDQEMRISQEIILGMGGVLILQAMGIKPSAWHMNEGHSVFLALQRIKSLVKNKGLTFEEALEAIAANTIFTTHTPVPAGNDAFALHIKDKYFQKYWESVGIRRHQFLELGSRIQPEGYEIFNLTVLALNLSRYRNGVSMLHSEISKDLWKSVWPDLLKYEIPISYITNGVHMLSWTARATRKLFNNHLSPKWEQHQDEKEYWAKIHSIPDNVLWNSKLDLKQKMIELILKRLEIQFQRNRIGSLHLRRVKQNLKPDILTIGFARRFATYKRGTLIFRNIERIRKILSNNDLPVQLIFAGKAHPKDGGGQDLIRQIYHMSLDPEFRGKIIIIENYDMGIARRLTAGIDIWLNNPRRTKEASGTSGQKTAMNGGINFSVLDGWWVEGYDGTNGWAFGDKNDFTSLEEWDSWDSEELLDILENDIIPLYYKRDEQNLPVEWIFRMKKSMETIIPQFNTHRMLKEYTEKIYCQAMQQGELYQQDNFKISREYVKWKKKIELSWSDITVEPITNSQNTNGTLMLNYGDPIEIKAKVSTGNLDPSDIKVQIYLTRSDIYPKTSPSYEIFDMDFVESEPDGKKLYKAIITPSNSGYYVFDIRALPYHPNLANPVELGIIKWAENKWL